MDNIYDSKSAFLKIMEEADLGSFSEVINDGTIFVNENNQVVFTVLEKETTFVKLGINSVENESKSEYIVGFSVLFVGEQKANKLSAFALMEYIANDNLAPLETLEYVTRIKALQLKNGLKIAVNDIFNIGEKRAVIRKNILISDGLPQRFTDGLLVEIIENEADESSTLIAIPVSDFYLSLAQFGFSIEVDMESSDA